MLPEALENVSQNSSQNRPQKVMKFEALDMPKLCEGSQKTHFQHPRKIAKNAPLKALHLKVSWAPEPSKTVPEEYREKKAS